MKWYCVKCKGFVATLKADSFLDVLKEISIDFKILKDPQTLVIRELTEEDLVKQDKRRLKIRSMLK